MSAWEELMQGQVFLTDLGSNQTSVINGEECVVGRYAVWSPVKNGTGHKVVEVSEELEPLVTKYKIPEERVLMLAQG